MKAMGKLFWVSILVVLTVGRSQEEGDVFQAGHDWKDIREGQKVPAGLHYRMNLQTGRKEAKLLSDEDSGKGKFLPKILLS
jgi:nucleotide exchange factor SIL1